MIELQVADMTCGHCVRSVTEAVKALAPQSRVAVDLASKSVSVEGFADAGAVSEAIREAGYSPVVLKGA